MAQPLIDPSADWASELLVHEHTVGVLRVRAERTSTAVAKPLIQSDGFGLKASGFEHEKMAVTGLRLLAAMLFHDPFGGCRKLDQLGRRTTRTGQQFAPAVGAFADQHILCT
jgi:hypothetical protein